MGLSRTIFDKQQFQWKIAKFSHHRVFCTHAEGVPLELGTGLGVKKLEWWGYWVEKEVWRYDFSFLQLELTNTNCVFWTRKHNSL